MSCSLCDKYNKLFSFDVGGKIQEFFGSPHVPNEVMTHSRFVKIDYKKIEWKNEEEIFIEVKFMCADGNLIHTVILENSTDTEEVESNFNHNSMLSVVSIINELRLEIFFKGVRCIRMRNDGGIFDIDPDEVLIYSLDNSLATINMAVYY